MSTDPLETAAAALGIHDLDRRIWSEELDEFVPRRVFDLHNHLTRAEFDLGQQAPAPLPAVFSQAGSMELLNACERLLYPGREVTHLIFAMPHRQCDFEASNRFIAGEARKPGAAGALMLVHPGMPGEEVERAVRRDGFLGFKPYRWYSVTGEVEECRIPDYLPDHQLQVADRHGLIVGLHLSRKTAIADPLNLDDLERLAGRFPRVRWVLFHCARSYSFWAIERAAKRLRAIPNLWYETSSVCETDAFDALFSNLPIERICYGSDDFPVGVTRGKYIAYGYSWVQMDETNQSFRISHCDGRMTFVRYEMLRAMRAAARHAGLAREGIEALFHGNASRLVETVRS